MRPLIQVTFLSFFLTVPAALARGENPSIPQDPKAQQKRYEDTFAYNRRTLAGAYDKVGKKDARWDKPAHEALEAATRFFSHQTDPCIHIEEVYTPAKKAIDAGCNDPLILYLYATSSYDPNFPGLEEQMRRFLAASAALHGSAYPPFRQMVALRKACDFLIYGQKNLSPEVRKEITQNLDAQLALLSKSVQEDEINFRLEQHWYDTSIRAFEDLKKLNGDSQAAFDHVDAALAKIPKLKTIRSQVHAQFLIQYAWEARGNGFSNTVTEEGAKKFRERLQEAREVLEKSWEVQPNEVRTATMMLSAEKGLGGERKDMEKWFERAMKADGDFKPACVAKLDWLDPKWLGSEEELIAFGRACRDTKNWRARITLLVADAHNRTAQRMPHETQSKYWRSPEVKKDIQGVFEEYLRHYPTDDKERTRYAAFSALCGEFIEADKQFRMLGDNLTPTFDFPEAWLKQARSIAAAQAKQDPNLKPKK